MLGEWVGWRRWTAILVGFSGVLLVVRPGMGGIQWAALLSFCSAVCYAFYNILTRMLSRTDTSETTLFYANLFGCVVMAPILPFVWTTPPSWLDVVLMLAMGAFGAGGHFLLILAHRGGPASVLSPFIYTQIVWASTLGYLVFDNVPSHWTVAGAVVVIASGLYLLNRERKVHGAVAPIETG
jgi:drug/metabolite transporter (DMT)-like permease